MATVRQVLARIFVDDVEAALPMYESLADGDEARRFDEDVRLAWIGPFLLLQVALDQRARYERVATLLVDDIDAAAATVERHGGTVLEGPADAPNGPRMIARHGDGAAFEYIQPVDTFSRTGG